MKAVLVTGGNSGIGFECARRLAREGLRVIIASRDREASAEAVRRISRDTGNDTVDEMGLDLASLSAIRDFAKELRSRNLRLRALVCNAGIQLTRGPVLGPAGCELTFAVNHLGHFLLTHLLLEELIANGPARIVIVSSGVHDPARRTGMPKPSIESLDDLATRGGPADRPFNGRLAYVNSKLCNLWFTYELVRRIEAAGLSTDERPLSVNAFEPGLVPASGLARDYPPIARFLWNHVLPVLTYVLPMANTAERSGSALAGIVLEPSLERMSGKYFPSHTRFEEAPSSNDSYDAERARQLWEASVRLSGLAPGESPLARS
jgi:NAD(P)-dependent dehydrogenase (short-subunit alcohol dehydrogenase family)